MPTTPMRILIAEDETIIRLDLRELLERSGFDVVAEARDGEEAVALARSAEPDVAVLDVKMPRLDGIDAARRILDERPIPIVMVTAYGEQELVARAVEAGVFGYLVKPFRESDLLPAIHTARARHEELVALREEASSLAEALAARKAIGDAMRDGGTITVLVENRTLTTDDPLPLAEGDYVAISVIDRGCGIPADMIDKVLEPFFTTKDVGKGTGLGLSMVYGFAKQSGGAFRLDSQVDEGTCAELWLPRSTGSQRRASSPNEKQEEPESHSPLRILLIDDHDEVRGTTAAMLSDLGHSTCEASSGSEAIELIQSPDNEFDLLITDYAMPRQSGLEVVRIAREKQPELPAIIVTGYADEEEIGSRPSKVGLLMKPFTLAKLSAAVREASSGQTAEE